MRAIVVFLIATFGLFALFYLMGCFIQKSFNLKDWTEGCRWAIGSFGGLAALLFGGFASDNYKLDK